MKNTSFLTFLVGAVLCLEIAHAMVCFTCEQQRSNWNCLKLTSCPQNAQKCLTIASLSGTGNKSKRLITKMCAPTCPTLTEYSGSVYCCGQSFCNIGPPK